MKRFIKLIKIVASLVFVVPIIVFIVSTNYIQYVYKKENPELFDHSLYDKPSIEELSVMLDDLTKNLPPPSRESQYKKDVLISIIRIYDEPEEKIMQTLIDNIENAHVWKKIESTSKNEMRFCNEQLALEVDKENDYQDKEALMVSIGWEDTGDCRKLYFNIEPEKP